MVDCAADTTGNETTVEITRRLLYGSSSEEEGEATPTIVVEFAPFDGKEVFKEEIEASKEKEVFEEVEMPVKCQLQIFSQIEGKAIKNAELQEVELKVKFGFSELGSQSASIDELINATRTDVFEGALGTIGDLENVLKTLRSLLGLVDIGLTVVEVFSAAKGGLEGLEKLPPTKMAALAACFGFTKGEEVIAKETVELLQVPLQLLTCQQVPAFGDWYNTYVRFIINAYNLGLKAEAALLNIPVGTAVSVYDNLYLSIVALCIPGIIHNIDKFRQIECRKIYCLENEVPAGVATVTSCKDLADVMECKYVWGELWSLIPFVGAYNNLWGMLQSFISDPIAMVKFVFVETCGVVCLASGKLSAFCDKVHFTVKIIDLIESLISTFTGIYKLLEGEGLYDYCSMVEEEED